MQGKHLNTQNKSKSSSFVPYAFIAALLFSGALHNMGQAVGKITENGKFSLQKCSSVKGCLRNKVATKNQTKIKKTKPPTPKKQTNKQKNPNKIEVVAL